MTQTETLAAVADLLDAAERFDMAVTAASVLLEPDLPAVPCLVVSTSALRWPSGVTVEVATVVFESGGREFTVPSASVTVSRTA